ncbi:hypothetical protein [Actinokineospora xionganensis]|nr:hypothetical protein [Actinokineospora xionganensis]
MVLRAGGLALRVVRRRPVTGLVISSGLAPLGPESANVINGM